MLTADKVLSPGVRKMLPIEMKGFGYSKVKAGDVKTITDVVYNVYQARNKDGQLMETQAKEPVINVTAYVGFDDDTLSTFTGKTALGQLASETGDIPTIIGVYHTRLANPIKVEIIEVSQKFGNKEYPMLAFEPIA